ncbi:NACHT domain-containing protein [Micromonospora saelicesensis]|uniref:NACHT domain-containing protein n=1 Tax=Micromonospora saelicesensis TaxID=285676 RepID=UPI0011BD46B5|nr:NACHT domain-containing protein [Micromonospora saelicesensis]
MPLLIEPGLLRAATRVLGYLGRRSLAKHHEQKLAGELRALVSANTVDALIHDLSPPLREGLVDFVNSAQLEDIMLRLMLWSVTGTKEAELAETRAVIQAGLKRRGFSSGNALLATDVVLDLMKREIGVARNLLGANFLKEGFALSVATDVAAANVRRSELLHRVEETTELEGIGTAFRRQVVALKGGLSLTHIGSRIRVPFERLYVTPELSDSDRTLHSLEEILTTLRRCVILGDPGAGKSTFSTKLARDLANDSYSFLSGQVPVLFITRDHVEKIADGHVLFLQLLLDAMRQPYNVDVTEDCLEYLLLSGSVTVIVDGIDEISRPQQRRRFTESVEGFAHLYPHARIIVTSRTIGYGDAALDSGLFPQVYVRPFKPFQVKEYAEGWFGFDENLSTGTQHKIIQAFMIESSSVEDLRANPLMLSLLCSLYSAEHAIPRHRAGVYERCAELLFEEWDKHRGITVPMAYSSHLRPAVANLAWYIFSDAKGRQELPRSEARAFLASYLLERRFSDEDEAIEAADGLLDFCAGRAWVLTRVGSKSFEPWYGFTHRTFLEYFAAVQLVRRNPTPEAVWAELQERPLDASWNVIAQLALQIVDKQNEDGADRVLSSILTGYKGGDSEGRSSLAFAVSSLSAVIPTTSTVVGLTNICFDHCARSVKRTESLRWSYQLLDRAHEAAQEYDELLVSILRSVLPENRRRVRDAVHERLNSLPGTALADVQLLYEALTYPYSDESIRVPEFPFAPIETGGKARTAFFSSNPSMLSPGSDSITAYGPSVLYRATEILGSQLRPHVFYLLQAALDPSSCEPRRQAATRQLEEIYEGLINTPWPWLRRSERADGDWVPSDTWDGLRDRIEMSLLVGSLSRRARGSAVLLMLPMWQRVAGTSVSGIFESVASARYQPLDRTHAHAVVSGWWLPPEADGLVHSWVDRTESTVAVYR